MIGNPDDAEELTQEVFIRVFKSLKNFKEQAQLSTWIYRITSNICLDEFRKRKNRRVVYLDQDIETEDSELKRQLEDDRPTPEAQVEKNELQKLVGDAIQKLPENHRIILIMRDINGMSYEEIARVLNSPEGTIKSRINRARQALKDSLKNKRELFDSYYVK
jgi:RNA polymerase sigma-70 factor (ECF subfamily)